MDEIAVAVAADDRYAQHGAVACASILLQHQRGCPVHVYFLSDNISKEKEAAITATVTRLQGKISFIATGDIAIQAHTSGHINRAAYLRLMLDQLLPENVTKVIYLDTDLLVLDDIETLWHTPLEGKPMAAVPDLGILCSKRMVKQKEATLGIPAGDLYFNSGVMVLDLAAWRSHHYGRQVLEKVAQGAFRHHDQDGLNLVFKDNWQALPLRWNVIPPIFTLPLKVLTHSTWRRKAIEAAKHPAVFHWAGRYKPWEFERDGAFNERYYDVLKETAFADVPMPQPSADMKGKSIGRQEFRMKVAKMWERILS